MDVYLKNKKLELGLLLFLLLVTALVVTQGNLTGFAIAGAITDATELRWSNGSAAILSYDNYSLTYGDPSLVNDNMFLHLCSNDFNNDLSGKFVKLVYRMNTNEIDLTVLPAQVTGAGPCVNLDLDLDNFAAYYPGVVTVAVSNDLTFAAPTYHALNQSTGFLKGNYTVRYQQNGPNVSINISEVRDDQNNLITTDVPFMIVGIRNSSGSLIYANITNPGHLIEFPYPSDTNFTFVINNYDVLNPQLIVPEVCTNNIDDNFDGLVDCADPDCAAHAACQPAAAAAGGGGGGTASECYQRWACGSWLRCQPDGTQTRECLDLNDCLNKSVIRKTRLVVNPKPTASQTCIYEPACDDLVVNQDETDTDCGGEICTGCEISQHCLLDRDCLSQNCFKNVCRAPNFQCLENADCPPGFTCEQFECLFLKVFRKPAKLTSLEKYILWVLLALILLLSSYITYEHYTKSKKGKKVDCQEILNDFIRKAFALGYSPDQVRQALLDKGWPAKEINSVLDNLARGLPKPSKITLKEEIVGLESELKDLKYQYLK